MALIVFQRFIILTGNLQESHMTENREKSYDTWDQIYSGRCKLQESGNKKNTPFCKTYN
jgi:hypothetical protein